MKNIQNNFNNKFNNINNIAQYNAFIEAEYNYEAKQINAEENLT